jgi:hypothetical protein
MEKEKVSETLKLVLLVILGLSMVIVVLAPLFNVNIQIFFIRYFGILSASCSFFIMGHILGFTSALDIDNPKHLAWNSTFYIVVMIQIIISLVWGPRYIIFSETLRDDGLAFTLKNEYPQLIERMFLGPLAPTIWYVITRPFYRQKRIEEKIAKLSEHYFDEESKNIREKKIE